MIYYLKEDVYTAALNRVRYLFDEFDEVIATISGGKDSTVIFNLCLQVARDRNRLPLKTIFIDQEAEWQHTIDYVRSIMEMPEVFPVWYQMPIKIFNATSHQADWLYCWKEGEKWMREKEQNSIKVNNYGTDRFNELFTAIIKKDFAGKKVCEIGGVRAEENPKRRLGLTCTETYKGITWGKVLSKKDDQYTFYPIYDWSYTDVWHYICKFNLPYNKIYDFQYSFGLPINKMRVSNLHHETALHSLEYAQEFERDTWNKLVERLDGVNSIKHLQDESMMCPKELPYMFSTWKEYRDYLLEKMVLEPHKKEMRHRFLLMDIKYDGMKSKKLMYRAQITSILVNDYYMTKIDNFERRPDLMVWRKFKKTGKIQDRDRNNPYIFGNQEE
ncbi:MAG: phosphoadenosine phosphosulfate reductase family protein [Termitinemataceae bacterium]|nr:MAG: phosphoadenosine phosphosulfate reductase family protein [Termitinemataceae bacterium]